MIARRLNVGFEGATYHGVDRCATSMAGAVVCRWSTGGTAAKPIERTVRLTRSTAGYVVTAGRPRPSPRRGRDTHLLGAPFDASA